MALAEERAREGDRGAESEREKERESLHVDERTGELARGEAREVKREEGFE